MSEKKDKISRKHMTDQLRKILGHKVPVDLLDTYPDLIKSMAEGTPAPTFAELVAMKIARLAVDGQKSNQWAVELIFDRVEGRAATGVAPTDGGRAIDEKLDRVTQQHLNDLAKQFVETGGGIGASQDGADRPASKLLDLPKHGLGGSEDS